MYNDENDVVVSIEKGERLRYLNRLDLAYRIPKVVVIVPSEAIAHALCVTAVFVSKAYDCSSLQHVCKAHFKV